MAVGQEKKKIAETTTYFVSFDKFFYMDMAM